MSKICPLYKMGLIANPKTFTIHTLGDPEVDQQELVECDGEDCQWWELCKNLKNTNQVTNFLGEMKPYGYGYPSPTIPLPKTAQTDSR